jgi:peptidoglycan/LPS O-acetylase OafA/YrhL
MLAARLPPDLFLFRPIAPRLSTALDALRWLAAALVLHQHVRALVFVDYDPAVHTGWFTRLFMFLAGYGHHAVIVFFVLSGYLVGGEVLRSMAQGTFDWRVYLVRRAARLYLVYLAALALGLILDNIGVRWFNASGLYSGHLRIPVMNFAVDERLGPTTLLGNLIFLQRIAVPPFGSNEPLWSLTYEVWYYLLWPLLLWPFCAADATVKRRLFCAGLALGAIWVIRGDVLCYFAIWLLGITPHLLRRPWRIRPELPAGILLVLLTLARFRSWGAGPSFLQDCAIGACIAWLISTLVLQDRPGQPTGARWHRWMAGFSYSLYVFHSPILILAVAMLQHGVGSSLRMSPTLGSAAVYLLFIGLLYASAWLLACATEDRTADVRAWLMNFLRLNSSGPLHRQPA